MHTQLLSILPGRLPVHVPAKPAQMLLCGCLHCRHMGQGQMVVVMASSVVLGWRLRIRKTVEKEFVLLELMHVMDLRLLRAMKNLK